MQCPKVDMITMLHNVFFSCTFLVMHGFAFCIFQCAVYLLHNRRDFADSSSVRNLVHNLTNRRTSSFCSWQLLSNHSLGILLFFFQPFNIHLSIHRLNSNPTLCCSYIASWLLICKDNKPSLYLII